MKALYTNNATAILSADIDDTQTTIEVSAGSGALFPSPNAVDGEYYAVTVEKANGDYEIMHVSERVDDVFTVSRGEEGTTAIPFSASDIVELRLTASTMTDLSSQAYEPDSLNVSSSLTIFDHVTNPILTLSNGSALGQAYLDDEFALTFDAFKKINFVCGADTPLIVYGEDGSTNSVKIDAYTSMQGPRISSLNSAGTGDVDLIIDTQDNGSIKFHTGILSQQFEFARVDSGSDGLKLSGGSASVTPRIEAQGNSTNVGIEYATKGTGAHTFEASDAVQFKISPVTSAVNYFDMRGGVTGASAKLFALGSDANIDAAYYTKGSGDHFFVGDGTTQFRVAPVSGAVNYMQAAGNTTGSKPSITAQGADANIGMTFTSKGVGDININCGGTIKFRTLAGETHAAISTSGAAGNNYPALGGGASANFYALGTDTNVNSQYWAKGTGQHLFYSSGSDVQFVVDSVDNTTNYVKINASASSFGPTISVQGSEAVANLNYAAKSTAGHVFKNGSGNQFTIGNVASSVNWLTAIGATTGTGPRLLASGSDTDIDVRVVPKGAGKFEISGTSATSGSVTQTHYLPIKINGTDYNLMLAS